MPKLAGLSLTDVNKTLSGFGYTSMSVDKLGASEYTLVGIVVDKTGSVSPFKDQLEDMLALSLESCKKSPRALNLVARSTATKGKLAKLAQFVSQSTSSQSQALGSGGVSQPVDFTF
jgi:hypothetical protein